MKTTKELLNLYGLDFQVSKEPIYCNNQIIQKRYGTVRSDNGNVLGIVSDRYKVFQNDEALSYFDGVIGKGVEYHNCGSFGGGKTVYLQLEVGKEYTVNQDNFKKYLTIINSHDGTRPIQIFTTSIRIICTNTMNMALKNSNNKFTVRHTTNNHHKIEQALRVIDEVEKIYEKHQEFLTKISKVTIGKDIIEKLANDLIIGEEKLKEEQVSTRSKNLVESLIDTYYNGIGQPKEDTLYKFYNSVTNFNTYKRYNNQEEVLESSLYGTNFNLEQKSLSLIEAYL